MQVHSYNEDVWITFKAINHALSRVREDDLSLGELDKDMLIDLLEMLDQIIHSKSWDILWNSGLREVGYFSSILDDALREQEVLATLPESSFVEEVAKMGNAVFYYIGKQEGGSEFEKEIGCLYSAISTIVRANGPGLRV